jgi:YHS domain-containing protein
MLRLTLLIVLFVFFARAFWRLMDGIIEGASGTPRTSIRPAQMVRDPICGTFILPDRGLAITENGRQIFFCSSTCRDKYRLGRTA